MRKILIAYATAGIGHKKAAQAVKAALDEMAPADTEVRLIDALDYTGPFFKWLYLQMYLFMVNKTPTFWGLSYYFTDNPLVNILVSKLRRLNNWFNSKKLREYLLEWKPDAIISTHFFASEVIGDMKKQGILRSRLITVITDYGSHSWWIADKTDAYVVACEDTKGDLIKWGVEEPRIKVLGIPVEPIFSKPLDGQAILDKTGMKDDRLTALVIGGGFGVGPIEAIVKIIDSISRPMQIIAICGHNEELVKRLEALKLNFKDKMVVFGFVNNVYEYMEIADLLISKSGGITVSESLAKELPMVVIAPIIGQETRNSSFLVSHGAAIKVDKIDDLREALEKLTSHPERLVSMRSEIQKIKKPASCYDVAKLALEAAVTK
ncbi:MAG: glycosyltransferase [Candidatus Omnitrophica bacterium]|nr:glycosyltransferase [Candidatus Omnitrophota bacterium]MBU1808039.1 glycosyltransferase [Candidatus Omnitrophota bacterium]